MILKKYNKKDYLDSFENKSIEELKNIIENKLSIKIFFDNFESNVDSKNKGKIHLYDINNKYIGKIWGDVYSLSYDIEVDSHLGLKIEKDFLKKGFGNLLFDLWKKWSQENDDIFVPIEEFARTKSRINFLLNNGYELKAIWKNNDFEFLKNEEIKKIIKDVKNDFYGTYNNTFLLSIK